jgi:hypothetical protein
VKLFGDLVGVSRFGAVSPEQLPGSLELEPGSSGLETSFSMDPQRLWRVHGLFGGGGRDPKLRTPAFHFGARGWMYPVLAR